MRSPFLISARALFNSAVSRKVSYFLPAGSLLIVGSLMAVVATVWHLRADALAEARRDTANLALVLGEQTERAVQAIDVALREMQDEIANMNIESPQAFERLLSAESVHQLLRSRVSKLPQAGSLAIAGARGMLVNSSRVWPLRSVDITDRDFYQHLSTIDDHQAYVSAPIQARLTNGEWTVYLARRINGADGHLLGLVMSAVQLKYFEDMYHAINLPRRETFTLTRSDGTVLVRHPDGGGHSGYVVPADSPWHERVALGGGSYVSSGNFDGAPKLISVHPLRDYSLVVSVGVTESAALAAWRKQASFIGVAAVLLLAYAVYLMHTVRYQFRRLRDSESSLACQNLELIHLSNELKNSQAQLLEKSAELETTLDTMDQGLMMIDEQGRIVICNKRGLDLLDVPRDFIKPETQFKDLLAYQWGVNKVGHDEGDFSDFIRARTVFDRAFISELRRPNGRIIECRSTPLPDGGVVRTYTDVTERKTAEERTRHVALHDGLTQLINRTAFNERLQEATMQAAIDQSELALFYLDLDHFKEVNDTRGHDVGDRVLAEAAQRMRNVIRSGDTLARVGGDEFAVILPFLDRPESAIALAQRLIAALDKPFLIDDGASKIGVSIGIALFPEHGATIDDLLRHADEALYDAKRSGRSTYRVSEARAPSHSRVA
jgi:diguanylate cyclase (GGDEF)-like protein